MSQGILDLTGLQSSLPYNCLGVVRMIRPAMAGVQGLWLWTCALGDWAGHYYISASLDLKVRVSGGVTGSATLLNAAPLARVGDFWLTRGSVVVAGGVSCAAMDCMDHYTYSYEGGSVVAGYCMVPNLDTATVAESVRYVDAMNLRCVACAEGGPPYDLDRYVRKLAPAYVKDMIAITDDMPADQRAEAEAANASMAGGYSGRGTAYGLKAQVECLPVMGWRKVADGKIYGTYMSNEGMAPRVLRRFKQDPDWSSSSNSSSSRSSNSSSSKSSQSWSSLSSAHDLDADPSSQSSPSSESSSSPSSESSSSSFSSDSSVSDSDSSSSMYGEFVIVKTDMLTSFRGGLRCG
jgi:hypothetical protein